MINGLGYKLANVPTVTGLSSVVADSIISGTTNTSQLILNGIDVSTTLSQVPINTNNITLLQTATTGITYSNIGSIDLTTIDNNVTITSGKKLKTATVPTATDDVTNKLYVDDKDTTIQQVITGITYNATGDLTTIDNNVTITTSKKLKIATAPTATDDVVNKTYCDTAIANLVASAPSTLDTLNELAAALGNDSNYATTTATLIGGKVSLATGPQTITAGTTMNNASNVFYGSGANLTGITTSAITTTTLPATGTYYPTLTDSSTGASSRVPYTTNQISYDRNNNIINFYGELRMSNTANAKRQINNTFYNLFDTDATTGGTYRGRIYTGASVCFLELDGAGQGFAITIGGSNVFEINTTALNCSVPISSTSTVSGATLQSSGNIYLTNSSAFIQTSTASANLSVGTQIGGGGLYLNGQGITGILITGTYITQSQPTTIETNITANLPSLKIKQTASSQTINFTPFAPAGTSNPMAIVDSSVISAGGGGASRRFVLTTDSAITLGIRMNGDLGSMVLGAGGTTGNPSNYLAFTGTTVVFECNTTPPTIQGLYTVPASNDNTQKIATTAWVQSAITSGTTNYMTLDTPQTVAVAGLKTFTSSITLTSTTNLASLRILASSSVANINFMAGVTPSTSTAEMTFGSANNVKSCVSIINPNTTNDGGIFLQAGNGGYLYGRNDGNAFNTQTSANGSSVALLYPIGYCFNIAPVSTKPVTLTALTTNVSIALTKGVWQLSGYIFINRSNGTFLVDSNVKVVYPTVAGLTIYPNASGLQFLIPHTNTSLVPMNIPIGAITVVCTTAGAILTAERTIKMTVGTTTTWSITFSGVKIA